MTLLIGIDRASIKRNPNAGRTQMKVPGVRETKFYVTGELPDILKDEKNAYISEATTSSDAPNEYEGYIHNESILEELFKLADKKDNHISIEMNQEWNTVRFLPEDTFFYKHLNVKVKCMCCGHKFKSNDFAEFDNDDSHNFNYTYTGCPKCKAWDCCNVKYEAIGQVESKYLPA